MLSKSFRQLVKGRIREFWREPSASFFVILVPLMWMFIFGFAFSGDQKKIYGVAVTQTTARFNSGIAALGYDKNLKVFKTDSIAAEKLMKRGRAVLELVEEVDHYTIRYDRTNPDAVNARVLVMNTIEKSAGRKDLVHFDEVQISQPGSRYIDFFIPGLLALSIMTSSLFGTGMTIVAFRRNKLFKRYCATPINTIELILSFIVGRLFILLIEFTVILMAGHFIFDFSISGNFFTFLGISLLGAASFTAISILSGAKLDNVGTYNGIVNLMTLPMMILSGVFFSRSNFPEWLDQWLDYLPLSPLVESLRRVALEGATLPDLTMPVIIMAVYAIVAVLATKPIFRWY